MNIDNRYLQTVADELSIAPPQVKNTAMLLAEGATVPFIARYRKEATGGLDEVKIIAIRDRLARLEELAKRREAIRSSLLEQGVLTDELTTALEAAQTLSRLEDIYLPFRPKRRTRASVARERGLEPLAEIILSGFEEDLEEAARRFLDPEREVPTAVDALAGARDIIAEQASENAAIRDRLRAIFAERSLLSSRVAKGKESDGAKYRDYFAWEEPARRAPSHRILAVFRGAEEGFLSVHLRPEEEAAMAVIYREYETGSRGRSAACEGELREALADSYRRLLGPSMETEARNAIKERADREAIKVFSANLQELLLAAPLGQRRVLAIDPGMRTGCKLVCLDAQGNLLHNDTIYPLPPVGKTTEAQQVVRELCERFAIEAIAVGNGTGGRETVAFLQAIEIPSKVPVVMVNESGASVYSASEVARREFPDYDVTVRGAVSIGRRLMDPLAELVKIDPKSIGVGQYQHDVDQKQLKTALEDVVSLCVNSVGVEVNTASRELLAQVSGLSDRLAGAFVLHRREKGAFASRDEFLKVAGMGPKTFEQSAGFLRIRGAENPLDASAVHPERYGTVERIAKDLGCSVTELIGSESKRREIRLETYVSDNLGLPTLRDILRELEKPGRDPRASFELFSFTEGVEKMEDLSEGMRLPGVVTNVTAFGAFVDVGVHQDGLVHISALADRFVRDPREVVRVGQRVEVTVLGVDLERRRISLSMKSDTARPARRTPGRSLSR